MRTYEQEAHVLPRRRMRTQKQEDENQKQEDENKKQEAEHLKAGAEAEAEAEATIGARTVFRRGKNRKSEALF